MSEHRLTRRVFVRTGAALPAAAALAGCAPASAPAPAPAPAAGGATGGAPAAWQKEWDDLVAAAKKEGKVVINFTGQGTGYQQIGQAFEAAFPGIAVEITTFASSRLWTPRVVQEHNAGVYTFDLTQIAIDDITGTLRPMNAIAPLRPALFHPDVVDDSKWIRGFNFGWMDKEKQYGFAYLWSKLGGIWVNTDLVKDGELTSTKDLLNPKWKGKMIFGDPRTYGGTFYPATAMRLNLGDSILKQVFVDQEPALSRDNRQITEQLMRGQYAISYGPTPPIIADLTAQGLAKNLKVVELSDAVIPSMANPIWMMAKAPHPNAAKLFVNWFLTRAAQQTYAEKIVANSRRTDVTPGDPNTVLNPKADAKFFAGTAEWLEQASKTEQMFKELIK